MSKADDSLWQWFEAQRADFGGKLQCTRHRLHELDSFTDDALIELLDHYPRKSVQAFTMGTDAASHDDALATLGALRRYRAPSRNATSTGVMPDNTVSAAKQGLARYLVIAIPIRTHPYTVGPLMPVEKAPAAPCTGVC